ncbi:HAD family hydrolase [Micromonospora peucetia]|uniref:HAD family hydrolase n=1 Tax=Micromonospora peucetia TaxID=47871 RepID=UPI00331CB700
MHGANTQRYGPIEVHEDFRPRPVLVLDVCGVLLAEPMAPLFRVVSQDAGKSSDQVEAIFCHYFRDALWSGRLDESAFWPAFAAACGLGQPSPAWRSVLRSAMTPLPAVSRLRNWSRGAQIRLLSNHRHEWLVPALQAAGLHRLTHRIFISSQTGAVKPNPSAYVQVLEQASPGDCLLYVDDKEVNVEAFKSLGVDGIQADTSGSWTAAVDGWLAAPTWRTW